MSEVVVFPDAVALTLTYLASVLPEHGYDVPTCQRVPNPRPAVFVRVLRVGGPRLNLVVDAATLTVEAWAADDDDAMALAQLTRALLHAMAGTTVDGVAIYRVQEFAGPAMQPDAVSDQPRAVATYSVETRGAAVPTS